MDISVTGSRRGEQTNVNIRVSASDWEMIDLIDSLSVSPGVCQIMAGKIAQVVGLVDMKSDNKTDVARMLRRFADLLEKD